MHRQDELKAAPTPVDIEELKRRTDLETISRLNAARHYIAPENDTPPLRPGAITFPWGSQNPLPAAPERPEPSRYPLPIIP